MKILNSIGWFLYGGRKAWKRMEGIDWTKWKQWVEWREFDWHNQYYTSKMKLNKWMKWMFDFMGPTAKKPQRANQLFLKRMVELWVVGYGWGPALCREEQQLNSFIELICFLLALALSFLFKERKTSWGEESWRESMNEMSWWTACWRCKRAGPQP